VQLQHFVNGYSTIGFGWISRDPGPWLFDEVCIGFTLRQHRNQCYVKLKDIIGIKEGW
jgi:hypothetical protein